MNIRPATAADSAAISDLLQQSWGSHIAVAHGVAYDATTLPAILAEEDDQLVGLLTYHLQDHELEIVTIDASAQHRGVGTALLEAATEVAEQAGARRLWLITTNDNLDSLRFYQRRGLRIVDVRPGAVDESRKLKPSIPTTGAYGIPLHDELVLELLIGQHRHL